MSSAAGSRSASPERRGSSSAAARSAKVYTCSYPACEKSFGRRDYLERHAANHLSARPHLCPTCGKSYARADVLKRHVLNHPRVRTPPPSATSAPLYTNDAASSLSPAILCSVPSTAPGGAPPAVPMSYADDHGWAKPAVASDGVLPSTAPADSLAPAAAPFTFELDDAAASELYTWFLTSDLSNLLHPNGQAVDWMAGTPVLEDAAGDARHDPARIVTSATCRRIHDDVQQMLGETLPLRGFTTIDMNSYIDLYYDHFDPLFPIIHRPTLRAREPSLPLLLVMLSIGASFAPDPTAYNVLLGLHRKLRRHVLEMVEDEPRPALPVLQALALVVYFGRMYGSTHDFEVNQVYHPAVVTAARSASLFYNVAPPIPPQPDRATWHAWAEAEERVRLAWMIFACDTENAAFLRHAVTIQASQVNVPLPCSDAAWHAASPDAWVVSRGADEPLSFRVVLRELLDDTILPAQLDSFALWAILHGLMALSCALSAQRPDAFTLARRSQITQWKGSVYRAIAAWHQRALAMLSTAGPRDTTLVAQLRAGAPICNICIVLLLSDLDAIQMFSGAARLAGRDISLDERIQARTQLETWAQTPEARQTCWFALESLQQIFRWMDETDAYALPPSTQWCAYLATITVWAYTTLVEERFVCVKQLNRLGPLTRCRVEPGPARRAALAYCERVLACEDPVNLPAIPDIGQCLAVVACAAHACGASDRGVVQGPTRTLYGLLKIIESRKKNTFVVC